MTQLSREVLETFFLPRAKPTYAQFKVMLESMLNFHDDTFLLGLNSYNSTLIYVAGQTVVQDEIIYQSITTTTPGPFNILQWNKIAGGTEGSLTYKGPWDADLNIPNLKTIAVKPGDYYVVFVDGNTLLNGIGDWKVGDWAITNGEQWAKIDNSDSLTGAENQGSGVGIFLGKQGTSLVFKSLTSKNGSVSITSITPDTDTVNLAVNFGDTGVPPSPFRSWSSEKVSTELNLKQNTIPYVTENSANKIAAFVDAQDDIYYPSAKLVFDQLALKQDQLTYTPEDVANKAIVFSGTPNDIKYPTEKLVFDQLTLKEPTIIPSGNITDFWSGTKTFRNLGTDVRALLLTGLNTGTNQVITDSDSIIQAFGFLQKQISDKVFGNNYNYQKLDTASTNTTSRFAGYPTSAAPLKITIPATTGTYRIKWDLIVDNNKKLGEFRLRNITTGDIIQTLFYEAPNANSKVSIGFTNNIGIIGTSHEFIMEYRAAESLPTGPGGGGTQNISQGTMEFFRVI